MSDPWIADASEPDPAKVRARANPRDVALSGRERKPWRPVSDLPEPKPQNGFVFRWVRTAVQNQADARNVSRRFAEGWQPVPADSQPELADLLGKSGINTDGNIEIGGLMLCRLPEETRQERIDYYNRQNRSTLQAVDNSYMSENDPRMPKLAPERRSTISNSL